MFTWSTGGTREGPDTLILTSNTPVNNWDQFFTGDDTRLCTLDPTIFDKTSSS